MKEWPIDHNGHRIFGADCNRHFQQLVPIGPIGAHRADCDFDCTSRTSRLHSIIAHLCVENEAVNFVKCREGIYSEGNFGEDTT